MLADTGDPVHPVRWWLEELHGGFLFRNTMNHSFVTDGKERYVVVDLGDNLRQELLPESLTMARRRWNRHFPYTAIFPGVKVKFMRSVGPPRVDQEVDLPGAQRGKDIPFIYEIKTTPETTPVDTPSQKHPAPSTYDMTLPKRATRGLR